MRDDGEMIRHRRVDEITRHKHSIVELGKVYLICFNDKGYFFIPHLQSLLRSFLKTESFISQ
jgi:hypothetical protein